VGFMTPSGVFLPKEESSNPPTEKARVLLAPFLNRLLTQAHPLSRVNTDTTK
jgi:hypothetical protein